MDFDNLLMDKVKRVQTQESVSREITSARKQLEKKQRLIIHTKPLIQNPNEVDPQSKHKRLKVLQV